MNTPLAPIVMVVDDDADCRDLAMLHLGRASLRVICLPGGRSAIEALEAGLFYPGAIVLDLDMPDVSGFDVWDWLQSSREHQEVPVVFWTGSALSPGALHEAATVVAKGSLRGLCEAVTHVLQVPPQAGPRYGF